MLYLQDRNATEARVQQFEYTVIPAPTRGEKARGAKTGAERFSYALLMAMNRMAANGWEYVRAETLPCEERSGLTSRTTVYHNVLVFRRSLTPPRADHVQISEHGHGQLTAAPAEVPQMHRHVIPADAHVGSAGGLSPSGDASAAAAAMRPDPAERFDPPSSWPDGPSDDQHPAAQTVPDRTHVPERLPQDQDGEDRLADDDLPGDDTDDTPDTHRRPEFGKSMPRSPVGAAGSGPNGTQMADGDDPSGGSGRNPPSRLGAAQR